MKQKVFGVDTHISEEELKEFNEGYSKCKDSLIKSYSTIKTEIIQGYNKSIKT